MVTSRTGRAAAAGAGRTEAGDGRRPGVAEAGGGRPGHTRTVTSSPGSITPELVRAAQQGSPIAMSTLLDLLGPYVGRICGPIALDDGADAAQECLITVFTKLHTLKDASALLTWARVIAVRQALRQTRGRPVPVGPEEFAQIASRMDHETGADIRDALSRLSPEHRAVLVLRAVEDLDDEAIAEILFIPSGTVKSRLHRARTKFRKEWQS